MKKIIAIFVIMLAFGVNANAQQKASAKASATTQKQELSVKQAAQADLDALKKAIKFEGTQEADLLGLFEYKHDLLKQNLSAERKSVLAQNIEAKITATLTPEQNKKVAATSGLMAKLAN